MNYLKLKQKIYEAIERNPLDRSAYEEMFAVCREYEKIDFQTAHAWNHELRNRISWGLRMTVCSQKFDEAREFDDLMFRSLLFGAQHFFDDYLQAVEYGKPLDKKFYQPRRHYLRRYVDAYQEILDGKLDFLSISMPKRAGKSQLGIGHLQEEMQKQGKRCKIIETPALDLVTDESNFEYMREGRKVFTTQYFRDQREMLSEEQFESEFQQKPFEAKGILFPEKSLNRYFELPIDRDPDSIIAVCDTADTGDDFCAMPIAAVYGSEVYIVDTVEVKLLSRSVMVRKSIRQSLQPLIALCLTPSYRQSAVSLWQTKQTHQSPLVGIKCLFRIRVVSEYRLSPVLPVRVLQSSVLS